MLLMTAALLMTAQAEPPGWETILVDQDGRSSYDPASVRRESGDRVAVRTRLELAEPQDGGVRFEVALLLDCDDRTSAFLSARIYDRAGALIGQRDTPIEQAEPRPVGGGSLEEMLHGRLCPAR